MSITLSVAPTAEPVSLPQAKAHLRITHSEDDTEINAMITAAREVVEKYLNRDIAQRTWIYTAEGFSSPMVLPKAPVDSITSIQYVDENGDTQTLSDSVYVLDDDKIHLKYDQTWPATRNQRHAVTITFVSGYAETQGAVSHAILMIVASMYENRESQNYTQFAESAVAKLLLQTHRRFVL